MSRDLTILVLFVLALAWVGVAAHSFFPVQIGNHSITMVGTPWWFTVVNGGAFVVVVLVARRHARRLHS